MHVVHCITRLILGGAQENTLWTIIDQMQQFGDRVVLITGPPLGPEGSLMPEAERAGIDVRVIKSLRRNVHPVRDFKSYRALKRVLGRERPQIVHTHSSKAGILGRRAAAELGIPAVHTVHGAAFHRNQPWWMRSLFQTCERAAARHTERWISVCDAMTDQYVAAGVDRREKFQTIYSGMDVEPFLNAGGARTRVRQSFGLDDSHVVIGKVARLFHLKGHSDVIEAAGPVIAAHPQVRFLFVGDGLLSKTLQEEVRQRGWTDRFVFAGLVEPHQVADMIHAMDIVVHASWREGLARVLPQALIAAKPVVSYDIDGAREVVLPETTGFLVQPGDCSGLATALNQLVSNPELRRRLGESGRKRFTDQFRHETMTRQIRDVYNDVLERRSGSEDQSR